MNRRTFLEAGIGALGAATIRCGKSSSASSPSSAVRSFPPGFLWGAATSAYQIEGGWNADGKGESVWDRFAHTPGKILNGDTGDVACDHYHRYREDVELMRRLNLGSYRFSISWSRIQPDGHGSVNRAGLDFYDRLTDEILAAGIRPLPTLFHYDLPQALSDRGGWTVRDTAQRFADYAATVASALGDRIQSWLLLNEPWVFTLQGYLTGGFPPGVADWPTYLRSTHVVNIAQGQAFRAVRAVAGRSRLSTAFSMGPFEPRSSSPEDQAAVERAHAFNNLWFLEPAIHGRYPDALRPLPDALMDIRSGDMDLVRAPFDFIGINTYQRGIAWAESPSLIPGLDASFGLATVGPKTDYGWEVWPQSIHDIVVRIHRDYGLPIEITENGCGYNDGPNAAGDIADKRRIDFHRGYLAALHEAIQEGADVRAYHAWSLMDNFEWTNGFSQRFGLVYVDFSSEQRTVKD
jgi:beta-glucosidase